MHHQMWSQSVLSPQRLFSLIILCSTNWSPHNDKKTKKTKTKTLLNPLGDKIRIYLLCSGRGQLKSTSLFKLKQNNFFMTLPWVMLEGNKVEKNSKQSIVTLVLPVEPIWEEERRDQGNTMLPSASVSLILLFLLKFLLMIIIGDYATTLASVSVAS